MRRRRRCLPLLAGLVLAGPVMPQLAVSSGVHVVATRLPGAPATALFAVDAIAGSVLQLPRFQFDVLPPLAVAIDPYDHHLYVALDRGDGTSMLVRLSPQVSWLRADVLAAGVSGRVTQLACADDDLLVAVDSPTGGLFTLPRRGGALTRLLTQPNLTALQIVHQGAVYLQYAWTGRPGTAATESGVDTLHLQTGQPLFARSTFANPTGRETTGLIELPTGVPRYLLAFADGSLAQITLGGGLVPVPAVPPPAGGATALKTVGFSLRGLLLGDAAHPFLAEVDAFTGAYAVLSQPLPGAPVDFAEMRPSGAQAMQFGSPCGPVPLEALVTALAEPGRSAGIAVRGGPPGQLAVLALGLDDWAAATLPAALPGGCLLHVQPAAVLWQTFDSAGAARHPIPVPVDPALRDVRLFGQWLHPGGALSVSAAVVLVVGV